MLFNALAHKHREHVQPPKQLEKPKWMQNGLQNVPKNKEYSAYTDDFDDSLIKHLQERAKAEKLKPKPVELTLKQ